MIERRVTRRLPGTALVLALACLPLAGCWSGPHLEVPTPAPAQYGALRAMAIHAVSINEAFIAGNLLLLDGVPEGLMLRSEDGGRTWFRMGFEVHDLRRVTFQTLFFADRLRGWVGGIRVRDDGATLPLIFRTFDGGNHWREMALPMDPGMLVTEIHSLAFANDETGLVAVQTADPDTLKVTETWFGTADAGRTWEVLDDRYRIAPALRLETPKSVMINKKQGMRLTPGSRPGITYVEVTASGGKDWLPVHEMSVAALATYYAPSFPGAPPVRFDPPIDR